MNELRSDAYIGIPLRATVRERKRHLEQPQLLLRETNHRWSNDMQLILALLSNAARRAETREVRDALSLAANNVAIIATNRAHLKSATEGDLELALARTAKALNVLSGDRIEVRLQICGQVPPLEPDLVMTIALSVNEIATNAIKHAFGDDGERGTILLSVVAEPGEVLTITVEDNGKPWPDARRTPERRGDGLELVRRMVAAHGGVFLPPDGASKRFEFRFALE